MSKSPLVGVIMGSDSDWETMRSAVDVLGELGIACDTSVVSAHRMPDEMVVYAKNAVGSGLKVIIAGAGGAAHLPGMVASLTTLPVIGVPVALEHLDGLDSLLSIVQMPAGVPVATVGIGNARNAGLLAARIIASGDGEFAAHIRVLLAQFAVDLNQTAQSKGAALKEMLRNISPDQVDQ